MTATREVETLYRTLLDRWNRRDAAGYGGLFTDDGSIVGFDGTCVQSSSSITAHLSSIFVDHEPAGYVSMVQEVRPIGPGTMLLRGIAGMVPPGGSDLVPDKNAIQVLVAVETARGWRIGHFQNTPATFDGRPDAAAALTAELRALRSG